MTPATFLKFLFILLLFNLTACTDILDSNENLGIIKEYSNTDNRLWIYFTRFEEAAARRGIHIDLSAANIHGVIQKINDVHVVGMCNHNSKQPSRIIIDSSYWKRVSDDRRELVVFHELGHCFLARDHYDGITDDGVCESIMRSGQESCLDFYNKETREDLLDELFQGY